MGNIQHYNALLYEKHKGLVDDLTSESRALRRELVESCKAFAEAMPVTVTDENRKKAFDLFMRDVHIAHDEFQKRLDSLRDGQHENELERLNREKDELNNRIAKLKARLEVEEKENADLRVELEKQKKDNLSLSEDVEKLQKENSEIKRKIVESFDGTFKKIRDKINNLINNAQELERKRLRFLRSDEVLSAIDKFREVARMLEKYQREPPLKYWREQARAKVEHK